MSDDGTGDSEARTVEVDSGAVLARARAELAELERDAAATLAEVVPDLARKVREARAKVDTLARAVAEQAKRPKRLGELLDGAFARLLARARGDERPVPVPWRELAELLGGGLWPGAHVLVASTGSGKTALQLQLALHAARAGVPVLYLGLELGELEVVARFAALLEEARPGAGLEGVKASDLLQGKVSEARFAALASAANVHLGELPLELETGDAHGWDYMRLVPAVRGVRERYGLDGKAPVLVVLDYLQLVSSPAGTREDVRERIGRAAYQAREAARHAGAAVLVTSSLARSNDKLLGEWGRAWPAERTAEGAGLRDMVGLGKEAGEVEFSADTVLVMAETRTVEGEKFKRVRVGVAKQRNGGPGELTLCFNGSRWFDDDGREAARKRLEAGDSADKADKEAERKRKADERKAASGEPGPAPKHKREAKAPGSTGADRAAGDEGGDYEP